MTTTQTASRWERFWTGPVWVKIAVCVAVGLAFGLIMGALINKSSGEEPPLSVVTSNQGAAPQHRCDPTETPCPQEARWHVTKFRHGKVDG